MGLSRAVIRCKPCGYVRAMYTDCILQICSELYLAMRPILTRNVLSYHFSQSVVQGTILCCSVVLCMFKRRAGDSSWFFVGAVSSRSTCFAFRRHETVIYGDRTASVCAFKSWNVKPTNAREDQSCLQIRRELFWHFLSYVIAQAFLDVIYRNRASDAAV